jgi:NADH dehydrogenase FAD-containing subunit
VELTVDRVTAIDPERRQVELVGADPIGYDLLVNALGSHADLDPVPGAAEHADAVASAEQAERLRDRTARADTVAVVGAGLTGLEVASELAESDPDRRVKLVASGSLGGTLSERGREHLHRCFERLGIDVVEHAMVAKVTADGLLLEDGGHVPADAVAWTTGFRASPLAGRAGLAVDDGGRRVVDATLRSESHPDVYGVGDAAAPHQQDGHLLRMGCGPGGVAALAAARAIVARLAGREPEPLRFTYVAQCISLGRRDGLIQFTPEDERAKEKVITGRRAALLKEGIVRGAAYGQRRPALADLVARTF